MTLRKRNVKIGNQGVYVIVAIGCHLEWYLGKISDQVNAFGGQRVCVRGTVPCIVTTPQFELR